jgi:hypothetical protein
LELAKLSVTNVLMQLPQATEIEERYLPFWQGVKKRCGNWFRIFNTPAPK